MKTLTQRTLEVATERREEAWKRMHAAKNEGAKKHWANTYERYARLVLRLTQRAEG